MPSDLIVYQHVKIDYESMNNYLNWVLWTICKCL